MLLAAVLLVAACGDDSGEDQDTEDTSPAVSRDTTTTTVDASEQAFLDEVQELTGDGLAPTVALRLGGDFCDNVDPGDPPAIAGVGISLAVDELSPLDPADPDDVDIAYDVLIASANHLCPEITSAVEAWLNS